MSLPDEDYPAELDLSSDMNDNALSVAEGTGEVVGAPPSSDVESYEEDYHTPSSQDNQNHEYEWNDDVYDSGSDDFDVEAYENEQMADLHIHDMSSYAAVGNDQETNVMQTVEEFEDSHKDFLQVLLSSAMVASIENMTIGFEPKDINTCLHDVGYCLEVIAMMYLGAEKFSTLPSAPVDWCHALKEAGHLYFDNGKFYPIVPESLREHCSSLIEGANRLSAFEAKRKQEQETYKSEDYEIRVLHTFNMIAELLHAVREEQRQLKIRYPCLMNAFKAMVEGLKHQDLLKKYRVFLSLDDPGKLWNNLWFTEYTGRSSLQKFIHMARFSEIAVTNTQPTTFYFRADDENREVKLFSEKDFADVRSKWQSGNQDNKNFGRNYGAGGQRIGNRGSAQQTKKAIEQDPNYRSARFNGIIDSAGDDGSLEPSTSNRNNRERSPLRPVRNRSYSPSPKRERSPSPYDVHSSNAQQQIPRPPSSTSQQSNPPPRVSLADAFGGRPVQRNEETSRGGVSDSQNNRESFGRNRGGDVRRLDEKMIGETSSEGSITSDGSYSNEDEDTKAAKRERRLAQKKKKDEREMRRRKQHEENRNKPIAPTRFSVSQFPEKTHQNAAKSPERRRQTHCPPRDEDEPATSVQPPPPIEQSVDPPVERPANSQTTVVETDEDEQPPVPHPTIRAPAIVTDSLHNEHSHRAQIPYRPSPLDEQKKKREQEEKTRKANMNAVKKQGTEVAHPHHPALISQGSGSGSAPQRESAEEFFEPPGPGGFGSAHDNQAPAFNEGYRGRNQPRHSQPVHQQSHHQEQPHYQQNQQQPNSSQQYPSQPPMQQHQQPQAQWPQPHQQQQPLSRGSSRNSDRQINNYDQGYNDHSRNRQNGDYRPHNEQQMSSRPMQTNKYYQNDPPMNDSQSYNRPAEGPRLSNYNGNQMNQHQQIALYQGNQRGPQYHQQQQFSSNQYHHSTSNQNQPYNEYEAIEPEVNRNRRNQSGGNNYQGYSNQGNNVRRSDDRRPIRDDDNISMFRFSSQNEQRGSETDRLMDNVLQMMIPIEERYGGIIPLEELRNVVNENQDLFPPRFDVGRFVPNIMSDRVRREITNRGEVVFKRLY